MSVSNIIGDRWLVSGLVTSTRWMSIRRQELKHFDQHWPQPVPPDADNLIEAELRKQSGVLVQVKNRTARGLLI